MNRPSKFARGEVAFLRKGEIETEAWRLLSDYGQCFGAVTGPPVPVDEVAELHLGLALELQDLQAQFGGARVVGAIWMTRRLIAVDQQLDPTLHPARTGRYHFTLAHEVGHWQLHRRYFLGNQDSHRRRRFTYVCRSDTRRPPMEWQADYFAVCLLMPRTLVQTEWRAWRGRPDAVASDEREQRAFRSLARRFAVPPSAMRVRLGQLGLLMPCPVPA